MTTFTLGGLRILRTPRQNGLRRRLGLVGMDSGMQVLNNKKIKV